MMKLTDYKCSKEQWSEMSIIEKRIYILQNQQEDTNWWLTTLSKLYVTLTVIGLFFLFMSVILPIIFRP